jgi:hypothetical protein
MNLRFDEEGPRVRLLPKELQQFALEKKLVALFPVTSEVKLRLELEIAPALCLKADGLKILVGIPEGYVKQLSNAIQSAKKSSLEVQEKISGVSLSIEVDYFEVRKDNREQGKLSL